MCPKNPPKNLSNFRMQSIYDTFINVNNLGIKSLPIHTCVIKWEWRGRQDYFTHGTIKLMCNSGQAIFSKSLFKKFKKFVAFTFCVLLLNYAFYF